MNGEFYQGGEFLPSTELPSRSRKVVKAKARKAQIAPYVWEVAPEGKSSIYGQLAGIFGKVVDGRMIITNTNESTLAWTGRTLEEVQTLTDRWNSGERWA